VKEQYIEHFVTVGRMLRYNFVGGSGWSESISQSIISQSK